MRSFLTAALALLLAPSDASPRAAAPAALGFRFTDVTTASGLDLP